MANARVAQVKYKGQVVDKAPMVCTPHPNNRLPNGLDGLLIDVKPNGYGGIESFWPRGTDPSHIFWLYTAITNSNHLNGEDWLVVN
tara:strand:+ start:1038 stop:1295 length:258 start_codon:yes stop_codon:yes gene_type:complete